MIKFLRKIARELTLKHRIPERYALERKIFPKIKGKKILYVGVGNYTKDYPKKLKGNDLTTIDINPHVSKFGARKHIIGDIKSINLNEKFDIIFLIGVLGYGVDTKEQAETTFENCHKHLEDHGILILLTSANAEFRDHLKPRELKSFNLFQPIEAFQYGSPKRMGNSIYEFLLKKQPQ